MAVSEFTNISHEPRAIATACPVCGLTAVSSVTRECRGIILADYICEFDHLWFVKWVAA